MNRTSFAYKMGDLEVLHHRNSASPSMRHLYSNQPPKGATLTPPSSRKSYAAIASTNANNNNTNSTANKNYGEQKKMFVGLERRSCLLPPDSNRVVRVRKTVVFADARGLALTQVRIMSEPSEVPPFWSHRFLSHLIPSRLYDEVDGNRGNDGRSQTYRDTWRPKFEQPARDYVSFRKKLEDQNVALENLVITQKEERRRYGGGDNTGGVSAVGTIKVKNLDYHKDVVVRYSLDGWKTYKDETCSHVPTSTSVKTGPSSAYHLHDTFRFELSLPTYTVNVGSCKPDAKPQVAPITNGILKKSNQGIDVTDNVSSNEKIIEQRDLDISTITETGIINNTINEPFCDRAEFCLRFRCAGSEYWDNNCGRNYMIQRIQHNVITKNDTNNTNENPKIKVREATYASMQGSAWSEFASWQHLENNCPYW